MPFDTYAQQDVDPTPVPLQIVSLRNRGGRPSPIVHVVPADLMTNPQWAEEIVNDADGDVAEIGVGRPAFDAGKEARETDKLRRRLARCIVKQIENVYEDDGTPTPSTPAKILEWMLAIPRVDVLRISRYAQNLDNFRRPLPEPAATDAQLAKK